MRPIIFAVLHSAIIVVILITPQFLLFASANTDINVNQLLGLILIGISFIAVVELFVISISIAISPRIGQIIRATWGLLIFPATFLAIIDFGLYRSTGSHFDMSTIRYMFAHIGELAPIVNSEMNGGTWVIIILAMILSLGLSVIGWKTVAPRIHWAYPLINAGATALLFLMIAGINTCFNTSRAYANTFYSLTNLTCRRTTADNQKEIISNATKLKIRQLTQQSITGSDMITPINRLFSAPPVKLQTRADSTLDNIVIILLESTRTDATTPYNPKLDTTPFLDKMAREGMKVNDAYVNYAYTLKSLVAVPCGIPPNPKLANTESEPGGIPQPCLPELLKPLGYNSAFFKSSLGSYDKGRQLAANIGYQKIVTLEDLDRTGWEKVTYGNSVEERAMIKPIMGWIDEQNNPFLLTVLTLTSHHPFRPPASFAKKKYTGSQQWSDYLNTVRYVDTFLQELFSEFNQRGLLENTLFIFTSDHGATIGFRDHRYPYQENISVPMILWSKHLIPEPTVVTGPRQHTDIVPTIVDLLRLKIAQGTFYGMSLRESADNRTIPVVCKFAICLGHITDQFKFFQYNNQSPPDLYDLVEDPKDMNNLAQLIPNELIKSYSDELKTWKYKVTQLYRNQRLAR